MGRPSLYKHSENNCKVVPLYQTFLVPSTPFKFNVFNWNTPKWIDWPFDWMLCTTIGLARSFTSFWNVIVAMLVNLKNYIFQHIYPICRSSFRCSHSECFDHWPGVELIFCHWCIMQIFHISWREMQENCMRIWIWRCSGYSWNKSVLIVTLCH